MEKNITNLSLVKMPHSNFKERSRAFSAGVGKCSWGQTLEFASERDRKMKLRLHLKFCSNPPKSFNVTGILKKACTMREQQINETERMKRFTINIYPPG